MTRPSSGEMELLSLLWERGPLSLSEVHEALERPVGYTTVQTRLNRLVEKGLGKKDKVGRQPTKYAAALQPEDVSASQLDTLVERVTRGSIVPLVAHLVNAGSPSREDLAELKKLLRDAEQRLGQRKERSK